MGTILAARAAEHHNGDTGAMEPDTGITVSATAVVPAPVDRVVVSIGVELLRPDAGEAFRGAAGIVERVLSILADNGVDSRSVRTAELSFGPRTNWQGDREVMLGYAASQELIATLTDLGSVETILTAVASGAGAGTRINSVSLTAAEPLEAQTRARAEAVASAREKAEHFAALTGRSLGPLRWLVEGQGTGDEVRPRRSPKMFAASADVSMPIAVGDRDIAVSVSACWGFAD
ncbi:MAG: SIMPL domain-containing protein [Williamsia herbipolensis]|nr:SIMPL domain-containing protein [Williamsia herbipolensis]